MSEKRKPSEVFLELWQWKALDLTPDQFSACADAWRQIVSLEEIYAEAERQKVLKDFWENFPARSPIMPAPTVPGSVTCAAEDPGDPSPAAQDNSAKAVTYDCASAPMPDPDPEAKYSGYMSSIKNTTRERLIRMRKEKSLTINDLLQAADGKLYWRDVMDMIEAKPVHVSKWELMAGILDKLEEAETGDGQKT